MKTLLFLILTFWGMMTYGQEVPTKHINVRENIGLEGYDPVSYFDGTPQLGEPSIEVEHNGVNYHFLNSVNKTKFTKNPDAYLPEYGGWCAYAMGENGEKVEVNPETFKIIDNQLYLFYNKYFNNTLKTWNKNETELKRKADIHWEKILQEG